MFELSDFQLCLLMVLFILKTTLLVLNNRNANSVMITFSKQYEIRHFDLCKIYLQNGVKIF